MNEELVFAGGVWYPRHRPDPDCWCRPTLRGEGDSLVVAHRLLRIAADSRQRAFMSFSWQPPV